MRARINSTWFPDGFAAQSNQVTAVIKPSASAAFLDSCKGPMGFNRTSHANRDPSLDPNSLERNRRRCPIRPAQTRPANPDAHRRGLLDSGKSLDEPQDLRFRGSATNFQRCWDILTCMGTWTDHAGRGGMRAPKRRRALLEVWLELLEKIEGPRRRRAAELRRRRDNPVRRVPNRSSRTFGALR